MSKKNTFVIIAVICFLLGTGLEALNCLLWGARENWVSLTITQWSLATWPGVAVLLWLWWARKSGSESLVEALAEVTLRAANAAGKIDRIFISHQQEAAAVLWGYLWLAWGERIYSLIS